MKERDLHRLIEECGEVIQAACKIIRFGKSGSYDDGRANIDVLTSECGDLLACMDNLRLNESELDKARLAKQSRLRRVERYELGFNCVLTREEREKLHKM